MFGFGLVTDAENLELAEMHADRHLTYLKRDLAWSLSLSLILVVDFPFTLLVISLVCFFYFELKTRSQLQFIPASDLSPIAFGFDNLNSLCAQQVQSLNGKA